MDAREFYHLARKLCSSGDPAELRCATGRAYYAAYNVAASMLRGWGVPIVRNAAGHGEVLRYLGNSGDNDLVAVGHKLGTLRARRNAADYDLNAVDVEDAKTVRSLVDVAGRVIDTMDLCLEPSRSTAIKAALDTYRRAIAPPPP